MIARVSWSTVWLPRMHREFSLLIEVLALVLAPGAQANLSLKGDPFKSPPNKQHTEYRPRIAKHGAPGSSKFQAIRTPKKKGGHSGANAADSFRAMGGTQRSKDGSDSLLKISSPKGGGGRGNTAKSGGAKAFRGYGLGRGAEMGKSKGPKLPLGSSGKGTGATGRGSKGLAAETRGSSLTAVHLPKATGHHQSFSHSSRIAPF